MAKFIALIIGTFLLAQGLLLAAETSQVTDPARAQLQEQGALINQLGNAANPIPESANAKILRRQERADHRAIRRKINHRKRIGVDY